MIHFISLAAYVVATAFACSFFGMSAARWIFSTVVAFVAISIPIGILFRADTVPRSRAAALGPLNLIRTNNRQWGLWAAILVVSICHTLHYGVGGEPVTAFLNYAIGESPVIATQREYDSDPAVQNVRKEIDEIYQDLYNNSPAGKTVAWATPKSTTAPTPSVSEAKSWKPFLFSVYCFAVWLLMIALTFIEEVGQLLERMTSRLTRDRGGRDRIRTTRRRSWYSRRPVSATEVPASPEPAGAATGARNLALNLNTAAEFLEFFTSVYHAMRRSNR